MPFVRALNYHGTPAAEADVFDAQLSFFARHFAPVGFADLLALAQGHWPHSRPGLIISFDDGLASHARVAAPLLEKHGFTGWFMVPTGFVDTPPHEQQDWARAHSIHVRDVPEADGRVALSWDEVRSLAEHHVIGAHTVDHVRFSSDRSDAEMEREIRVSRERLEAELGAPVDVFAWVGGEESSYSASGARLIGKSGFRVALMTNNAVFRPGDDLQRVQRTNIETHYDPALTLLHLSGLYDVLYTPKRRRVEALTQAA
jgi:peptidoglycan/xylan/chitin deacetylase (PgdA/CDA1 family)